jgi:hypothetical protein
VDKDKIYLLLIRSIPFCGLIMSGIVNDQIPSKEAPEYIKGGYNHPEEEVGPTNEETLPHMPELYK